MRVLQFGKHYPPFVGGTEKVIQVLTETLNKLGVKTDVLCVNHTNKYEELDFGSYKVYKTPMWFRIASTSISPSLITKLREIQKDYEIIHTHMPDPMANLALFLNRPRGKLVVQWHMDIVRQKALLPFYKPLLIWLFKRADLILVSSEKLKKESQFREFFNLKAEVLPLPFDYEEFEKIKIDTSFEKKIKELAKGRKIVFSVGRLVYYKGFDVLIKAARLLPDKITVFIVGDGPLRKSLQTLINKYKLTNKVFLLGNISKERIVTCYKVCDVFCLPSTFKTEAFGIVQLEAMSFGKPVISTELEASGVCEVNIHGVTGLCVKPGDEKELLKAIISILEDHKLYKTFSENALKRVKDFYKEKIVRQLIELYDTLL
ncbi:MAG: glycosyltransferase [Minisyncoccia bacterium]|jgi:rhamnosyl/mannosyltransferase